MIIKTIDPFFRRLFIVTAILISLYLLYLLTPVIIPFLSAFILAYLFNPIVKRLSRYMRRWIAIILVYLSIILGVAVLLWWLVPTIWMQLQAAWDYIPQALSWYNDVVRKWVVSHSHNRFDLPPLESRMLSESLVDYLSVNYKVIDAQSMISKLLNSGMAVINNTGMLVLVPILTFYFLFNWDKRLQQWRMALPRQYAPKIIEIAHDCDKALMAFVKGQLLVMILLGIVYAVQLQLIGLELGLIIGMVAGIASFVPYLGFGIGFIAAIIAGLFQFGTDWVHLSLIVGAFLVGQAVEGYILQPLLLGDKIGLSPLWVIFSVLAGAALLGFVGMLIALPVSAIINVLFQHAYAAYRKSELYAGRRQLRLFD
ncbi:AI-2E family transporter [Psychrobacter sp. I-STPA10]|uniref:AI-2E family transporter n=1 Tax=Psychrobacter sp. I-STPA10 TaxID=2585769 RepID=UPI001E2D3C92|nr:AI-2E family transporter [Psychrobacter sp. I-STPA10]